jgi:glycosyltransferase involved in cell wall biosynthesis
VLATVESPLPASLPARTGTALFCWGRCSAKPAIVVDGVRHRPSAAGMAGGVYWGVVPVPPRAPGVVEIALAAGGERVPVGRIDVVEPAPPPSLGLPASPGLIAVCMATYEPDPELLRVQLDSLRVQTDGNWVCVISDDASSAAIDVGGDERFIISRSERRRGFYGNFERALRLAPAEAELIALCDQDDRWHPDKLATLRAALGGAAMAYSDQRLVDARGRVLRDTMWKGRRNNHTDIAALLVANSITGAATLFRRHVTDLALPFPDSPGLQFHDHWLGLVALAAGDIAYVDRPLYDYVQHQGAVFGDVTHMRTGARRRLLRGGRGAYFLGYAGRAVQARTLLARCAMSPDKRRALERFLAAERSPAAFAWLGLRALTHRRETLGSELELLRGIAWRHARPRDVTIPDPLAFEQRRLRRWRARI